MLSQDAMDIIIVYVCADNLRFVKFTSTSHGFQ